MATFKQEGLERMVRYDCFRRKSLVDHFFDLETPAESVWNCSATERGDFAACPFEATVRRNPDRIQVLLSRRGNAWGVPFTLSKAITLEAGSRTIAIAYRLEGMPTDFRTHLAVEFNFAGMPGRAEGRFFRDEAGRVLGDLSRQLDLSDVRTIGLVDDWLDIHVSLALSKPAGLWAFPVESVSQSEGGFELVHQSVAVLPHWLVEPDAHGNWQVEMRLMLDSHRTGRQIPLESRAAAFAS